MVDEGVKTLIWSGDADWICNWVGTLEVARRLEHHGRQQFNSDSGQPFTVKGKPIGRVRRGGNLTWLVQWDAGHSLDDDSKCLRLLVLLPFSPPTMD